MLLHIRACTYVCMQGDRCRTWPTRMEATAPWGKTHPTVSLAVCWACAKGLAHHVSAAAVMCAVSCQSALPMAINCRGVLQELDSVVTRTRMFQYKPDGEVTFRMAQDAVGLPAPLMQDPIHYPHGTKFMAPGVCV